MTLRDPNLLVPHPLALRHFPLGSDSQDDELGESIKELGVTRPLTVTGGGCASPPGTVLNGNRRRRAAIAAGVAVPVRVLDRLTEADEERIVLSENLADQLGRRLLESERARLEGELARCLARGQGHRSDRTTSAGTSGGDTRDLVAAAVGATRNSVADRRTVFGSPLASDVLKKAVDAGKVSRSRAATLLREAAAKPEVKKALASTAPRPSVLASARSWVERQTVALTGRSPKSKRTGTKVIQIDLRTCPVDVRVAGRLLRVTTNGTTLSLLDVDKEPPSDAAFSWPDKPWQTPITEHNWSHVVAFAMHQLPDDIRSSLDVSSVTELPRHECPNCCATRFYRLSGGCTTCQPEDDHRVVDLAEPRRSVTVDNAAGRRLAITWWDSGRAVGDPRKGAVVSVGMAGPDYQRVIPVRSSNAFHSIAQLEIFVLEGLAPLLLGTHLERCAGTVWYRLDGSRVALRVDPGWVGIG